MPRPDSGSHQCCTSPSANCRAAARSICSRAIAGFADAQRHHVLQLVAKAVGAARLIERRPRPDAAGERLVQQPVVEHDVHRAIRRRTCTAPSVHPRTGDRGQHASRSAARYFTIRACASASVAASPSRKTISLVPFGRQLEPASAARRKDRARRRPVGQRRPRRSAAG